MRFGKKLIAGFLLLLVISFIYNKGYFEKLELYFYDLRIKKIHRLKGKGVIPLKIIGITDNFEKKTGEKFSRKHYTKILKILKKEKAKVIGFDIFFPSIKNKKEDIEFAKTIKESGNVVLPVFSPKKIEKKAVFFYEIDRLKGSASLFNNSARALGHINAIPDIDQVVRKFPLFLSYKKKIYPQLSYQMAKIFHNGKLSVERPGFFKSKGRVPIDDYGCFYINYLPPEKIKHYFIPFSDVLNRNYKKGIFRDKAVLIGQTILGAKNADLMPTPYGMEFGVFIQGSALYNALQDEFFYRVNKNVILMILFLYASLTVMVFSVNRIPVNTFYLFSFSSGITAFSFYALRSKGLFFDSMPFFFYTLFYYLWTVFHSLSFAMKKMFQKEAALKVLRQVEEEIANVVSPLQIVGLDDSFPSTGVQAEKLVKQTPEITLRTILASLGIESGCFVVLSRGKKHQVIAKEGKLIDEINIDGLVEKSELEGGEEIIMNKWNEIRNPRIKSVMIVPVIFNPVLKFYGIFINKKPTVFSKTTFFTKEDTNLVQTLALEAIIAIQNARLNIALKDTQMETIFRLSIAIEYRDRETGAHIHRVSEYAGLIAEGIGLTEEEVELIKAAMPLHDIGKIAIPDNVLLKPGKLTDEERKIVEKHPVIGAKMLEGSNSIILKAAEIIALYHHEKYNGSGYPFGLKGNSIPLYGRIGALADIFDALSSKRIYKVALDFEESFEVVKKEKGRIFDPVMVDGFLKNKERVVEIYKKYKEKESVIIPLSSLEKNEN